MRQDQIEAFKIALGTWNSSNPAGMSREELLDEGDNICGRVVETHEEVANFSRKHGRPDRVDTIEGPLFVWPNVQFGKGRPRGTLFLMPAAGASMFTGG